MRYLLIAAMALCAGCTTPGITTHTCATREVHAGTVDASGMAEIVTGFGPEDVPQVQRWCIDTAGPVS